MKKLTKTIFLVCLSLSSLFYHNRIQSMNALKAALSNTRFQLNSVFSRIAPSSAITSLRQKSASTYKRSQNLSLKTILTNKTYRSWAYVAQNLGFKSFANKLAFNTLDNLIKRKLSLSNAQTQAFLNLLNANQKKYIALNFFQNKGCLLDDIDANSPLLKLVSYLSQEEILSLALHLYKEENLLQRDLLNQLNQNNLEIFFKKYKNYFLYSR